MDGRATRYEQKNSGIKGKAALASIFALCLYYGFAPDDGSAPRQAGPDFSKPQSIEMNTTRAVPSSQKDFDRATSPYRRVETMKAPWEQYYNKDLTRTTAEQTDELMDLVPIVQNFIVNNHDHEYRYRHYPHFKSFAFLIASTCWGECSTEDLSLMLAAELGASRNVIYELMAHNENVSAERYYIPSLLRLSLRNGHIETAQSILDYFDEHLGALIGRIIEDYVYGEVAANRQMESLRFMARNFNLTSSHYNIIFSNAAFTGDVAFFEEVSAYFDLEGDIDGYYKKEIWRNAGLSGNPEMVDAVMSKLEAPSYYDLQGLWSGAAESGNLEMINILKSKFYIPGDNDSEDIWEAAAKSGNPAMIDELTTIMWAVPHADDLYDIFNSAIQSRSPMMLTKLRETFGLPALEPAKIYGMWEYAAESGVPSMIHSVADIFGSPSAYLNRFYTIASISSCATGGGK